MRCGDERRHLLLSCTILRSFTCREPPEHEEDQQTEIINIALVASVRGHPFLKLLLDRLFYGLAELEGVFLGSPAVASYKGKIPITVFSYDYFTPLDHGSARALGSLASADMSVLRKRFTENTYASHMWGCTWCPRDPSWHRYYEREDATRNISDVVPKVVRGAQLLCY